MPYSVTPRSTIAVCAVHYPASTRSGAYEMLGSWRSTRYSLPAFLYLCFTHGRRLESTRTAGCTRGSTAVALSCAKASPRTSLSSIAWKGGLACLAGCLRLIVIDSGAHTYTLHNSIYKRLSVCSRLYEERTTRDIAFALQQLLYMLRSKLVRALYAGVTRSGRKSNDRPPRAPMFSCKS